MSEPEIYLCNFYLTLKGVLTKCIGLLYLHVAFKFTSVAFT